MEDEKNRLSEFETPELFALNAVFKESMVRGNVVPAIFWLNREVLRELAKRMPYSPKPWET
jgi:hypothetical protein